jgi:hypothetical protein
MGVGDGVIPKKTFTITGQRNKAAKQTRKLHSKITPRHLEADNIPLANSAHCREATP